jgi:hypothetical protein
MQTLQVGSSLSAAAASANSAEGFQQSSNEIVWARRDWAFPLGSFHAVKSVRRTATVGTTTFDWVRIFIPQLFLGHRAAILLLQGMSLTKLLIPNHEWRVSECEWPFEIGHLVLRVDSWEYWRQRPVLTNLVLAGLGEIPAELSAVDVLGTLAADSAT